jgi:hypothetical protein
MFFPAARMLSGVKAAAVADDEEVDGVAVIILADLFQFGAAVHFRQFAEARYGLFPSSRCITFEGPLRAGTDHTAEEKRGKKMSHRDRKVGAIWKSLRPRRPRSLDCFVLRIRPSYWTSVFHRDGVRHITLLRSGL